MEITLLEIQKLAREFRVPVELMQAFVDRFAPSNVAEDRFRADSEVMLFIHIPKTAGVSVGRSLREAYDFFHGVEWNNIPQSFRQVARNALYRQIHAPERHVIMGHFGWPEMQMFRNHDMPLKCGTFFRDPVDRTISNYNYNCSTVHPANQKFRDRFPTIESYVADLANDVQITQSIGLVSSFENAMEKFIKYYSFIGITEYLPASLAHLAKSHGLKKLKEYRKNVGKTSNREDTPADLINKINQISLTDKKIHDLMTVIYRIQDHGVTKLIV